MGGPADRTADGSHSFSDEWERRQGRGRDTGTVKAFEPSVRKPRWPTDGQLPPDGGQHVLGGLSAAATVPVLLSPLHLNSRMAFTRLVFPLPRPSSRPPQPGRADQTLPPLV